jgi:hypothetical protein
LTRLSSPPPPGAATETTGSESETGSETESKTETAPQRSWSISRGCGEEAYEITPAPPEQSPPPPEPAKSRASSASAVDSVTSQDLALALDLRGALGHELLGSRESGESLQETPQRNLLHNFLSTDVSVSTAESSVLERVKQQQHHEQEQQSARGQPDFDASTVSMKKERPCEDKSEINTEHKSEPGSGTVPSEAQHKPDAPPHPPSHPHPHHHPPLPALLDTMLAVPDMLQPKALAEAVAMVMHASKPHQLTQMDFIECFEVLMSSGITPPLNSLLATPPSKRGAVPRTADEEARQCRPPRLHDGPMSKKLREKTATSTGRRQGHRSENLLECKLSSVVSIAGAIMLVCHCNVAIICYNVSILRTKCK